MNPNPHQVGLSRIEYLSSFSTLHKVKLNNKDINTLNIPSNSSTILQSTFAQVALKCHWHVAAIIQ